MAFIYRSGKEIETPTFHPHLAMNDFAGTALALLAGAGIGEVPPIVRLDLISSGELVEVMPDWRFRAFNLSLIHPGNRHIPKSIRLFKELAALMAPALFSDLPT